MSVLLFFLDKSCNLNQRMEKLRPLFLLFSNKSAFTVQQYANKSETKRTDATWNEREVVLNYLLIFCTSASELEEGLGWHGLYCASYRWRGVKGVEARSHSKLTSLSTFYWVQIVPFNTLKCASL